MTASVSSSDRFPELDKYELQEEIGHGGMATVYRARDHRLGRDVAVKIIHKHLRENAEVRRRFVSEARAVAKLRHRGIVEVYDVSAEEDIERFLVVELIRGPTLRQVLDDHGPLPAEIAAAIVAHLCDAVDHAHNCHVVHRDIKPENVLVEAPSYGQLAMHPVTDDASDRGASGEPPPSSGNRVNNDSSSARSGRNRVTIKLTDFGIAKVLDAQGVTSTGQILGSPAHMAPEQIEGGEVGPHTDVFALGVLFYECMVGHLPFEGKNPAQVLRRVLEGDFEPADRERPSVGGRWARLVASTLAVNVAERVPSALRLHELITAELSSLGIEHPLREVGAFFANPDGYREALIERLVPLIVKRGEKARRRRQVQNAAADFNRALAFRPDDHTILRRVTSLGSRTTWRRRLSRVAVILSASALLGAGAFGVTRALRPDDAARLAELSAEPLLPPAGMLTPTAAPTARPVVEPAPRPAPSGTATVRRVPLIRLTGMPTALVPKTRRVRISVYPQGAELRLDGTPTSHFGTIQELAPGTHQVQASVPRSSCCEPLSTSIQIQPPSREEPDAIQYVSLSLVIKPARAMLSGAPPGGSMTCGNGLTVGAGATGSVAMKSLDWTGSCTFSPGGKTASVKLVAGRTVPVSWP